MDRDLQTALDPVARQLRGPVLQLFQYPRRTRPTAKAAPAHLGRRPLSLRLAARRAAWRWLAPCRRDRGVSPASTGDAGASGHPEAPDGRGGTRFFGADDLLQS